MRSTALRQLVALVVLVAVIGLLDQALRSLDSSVEGQRAGVWEGNPLDFAEASKDRVSSLGASAAESPPVKNIIFLIADGMGFGHLTLARNAITGPNRGLAMEGASVAGWVSTHSDLRLYPDSASTATSLATGYKTVVGAVGVDAEGIARASVAEVARDAGKAVGLVTDSYLWDATPGAFAAHVANRTDYGEVARQLAASGFDLLVGGGHQGRGNHASVFGRRGWLVHDNYESWRESALTDAPVVGLFPNLASPTEGPSLLDVAQVAVQRLERNPEGFFLLVETEESDTASHRNDFDRVVEGIRSFDRVVAWAYEYAANRSDTLVLVTSDHDTGAPVVVSGDDGRPQRIQWSSTRHSALPVPLFAVGPGSERLGGVRDNTEIATILASLFGLKLRRETEPR